MACFLVSAAEAAVVTAAEKAIAKKEGMVEKAGAFEGAVRVPFARKLRWLRNMLWGGSALLAFEHVWHGEVVPWFPFLTAANDPADTAEMLHEMATVGVSMALLVTAVWAGMVAVSSLIENRVRQALPNEA